MNSTAPVLHVFHWTSSSLWTQSPACHTETLLISFTAKSPFVRTLTWGCPLDIAAIFHLTNGFIMLGGATTLQKWIKYPNITNCCSWQAFLGNLCPLKVFVEWRNFFSTFQAPHKASFIFTQVFPLVPSLPLFQTMMKLPRKVTCLSRKLQGLIPGL